MGAQAVRVIKYVRMGEHAPEPAYIDKSQESETHKSQVNNPLK